MVGEKNLRVIQRHHRTRRRSAHLPPLDAPDPAVFVRRRLLEAFRKFVARPYPRLAVLDELDFGVGSKVLCDEFAPAKSMSHEVTLDRRSRSLIRRRLSWRLSTCSLQQAERKQRHQKKSQMRR